VAGRVSTAIIDNPASLQALLEDRLILQGPFNAGVFATRIDGTAIAGLASLMEAIGVNYLDRDYIASALLEGKRAIGPPVISRVLRVPVFGMAVPIRDSRGVVIGALAGITNLSQPNFLDRITNGHYGQSGGYLLVAPQHRLVVTASDKSRVMEILPALGINPSIDRFLEGYEGSAVIRNPQGVEVLASHKSIPVAGWIAAVSLPTAEAFAPIRVMQQRMMIATVFLTLLAGGLIWWMLRRQLLPMLTAVRTLAAWSDTDSYPQPLPIAHRDEIGKLISSFNRLLEILGRREQALVEQSADLARVAMERQQAEASMRAAREQLEALTAAVPGVVYQLRVTATGEWQFLYVSRGIQHLYGVTAEEALRDHLVITDCILPERRAAHRESIASATVDLRFWEHEHQIMTPLGQLKWVRAQALPQRQADGSVLWNGVLVDITERKRMEDQVRQLALYDALTQLPNRRLLNDRLSQTLAASKRSGCYGALMFLDLDNFKPLNDLYGHAVGDALLIEVADRLKSCVREMDTVARFGGDEFVVVLTELNTDQDQSMAQAGIVAEKIRSALSEPYRLTLRRDGKADTTVEHRCTVSIGVIIFVNHEGNPDDLIKWADGAMYQAKEAGRNVIQFRAMG